MSGIQIYHKKYGTLDFGITRFPNRKSKCLYKMRGAMCEPLAYFRSNPDADDFEIIIDALFDILQRYEQNQGF